jgi:hypothetical protein
MKKLFNKHFVVIVISVVCIISITSCRKYNYTNRIINTWVVNKYLKNGIDSTANYSNVYQSYQIVFDNSYGFVETYSDHGKTTVTNQGTWDFTTNAKTLELKQNGTVVTYDVVSIKSKSMDLKISSKDEEFFYSPK